MTFPSRRYATWPSSATAAGALRDRSRRKMARFMGALSWRICRCARSTRRIPEAVLHRPENTAMLAAQVSANPNRTHLKSELIMKLTAAIQPIDVTPAITAPRTAHRFRSLNAVTANVSARRRWPLHSRPLPETHASAMILISGRSTATRLA